MAYLIGIDVGTSGTKTALYDLKGEVVAQATYEYPMAQPRNAWAEQNPEDWFDAVVKGLRDVVAGVDASDIKGIGLSGQMHSLVLLDETGTVIRPAILWNDQRTEAECKEITEAVGYERLLEITANPALTGFTAGKILWVKNHEPENFARIKHVLLAKDYIRYRLADVFATDVSDASGMQLLHIAQREWSTEVMEVLGFDPAWFATVYESIEVTGYVTARAADLTGLAEGTPIVAGAGDNAAAAVGTGVVRKGDAFTSIGTSGVVYAHTPEMKLDPKGRVHVFCCAVPGAWHVMGVTLAAGSSLQWFRNEFCEAEAEKASVEGVSTYKYLDAMAAEVSPGSEGLTYLPYIMGERTPHLDPAARGVFFGISQRHGKAHFLRSIMEGVAYSMRDCLEIVGEDLGHEINSMLVTGGGAAPFWREILTDVYGETTHTITSSEGPALGAALLAAVGVGLFESVEAAVDACVVKEAGREPNEKHHEIYDRGYELYRSIYPDLKETYRRLEDTQEAWENL